MIDEDYYIEFLVNLSDAEKESIRNYFCEWIKSLAIDELVSEFETTLLNTRINYEEKIEQFQLHEYDEVCFIYGIHNYFNIDATGIGSQLYPGKRYTLHIKCFLQGIDKKEGSRTNISELNYIFQI